jgi:hypothetical protein
MAARGNPHSQGGCGRASAPATRSPTRYQGQLTTLWRTSGDLAMYPATYRPGRCPPGRRVQPQPPRVRRRRPVVRQGREPRRARHRPWRSRSEGMARRAVGKRRMPIPKKTKAVTPTSLKGTRTRSGPRSTLRATSRATSRSPSSSKQPPLRELPRLQRKYNGGRKWPGIPRGQMRPGRRTREESQHRKEDGRPRPAG